MAARIDEGTVKKVARLARLELTDREASGFAEDLREVLSAFRRLQAIRTEGAEPTFQPVGVSGVLRDDRIEPGIPRDELLRNLRNRQNGFIKGPRV